MLPARVSLAMSTTTLVSSTTEVARAPWWARLRPHLSPAAFDVVLYGLSALFALVVAVGSSIPLYRQWGQIALGPYLIATGVAVLLAVRSRRRTVLRARTILVCVVVVGTAIIPMAFEIAWRFAVAPQALHVQPEVVVVEHAATEAVHGHDPYQAVVIDGQLHGRVVGEPAYEAFFPYLPAMTVFGLPAATSLNPRVTDARIYFVVFTLLCVALALLYAHARPDRRLRALQVAVALPWATLAMATGGDDLPIIGLLLVAMVLAQRRRPGWAGVVLGIASAMKFTAWPLAALALFAARDRSGRRVPGRMLVGIVLCALPLMVITLVADPRTFVANVIEFPLGLSGVDSPAGSALPGHILITAFPALHRIFPVVAAVVGAVVLARYLWRTPPTSSAKVCQVAGVVLLVAILLAPATRIGYLLYPLNFFVWSWMLTGESATSADAALDPSAHSEGDGESIAVTHNS